MQLALKEIVQLVKFGVLHTQCHFCSLNVMLLNAACTETITTYELLLSHTLMFREMIINAESLTMNLFSQTPK